MIEKIALLIVEMQIGIGTIKEKDIKVYQYGYILLIEVVLNIVLSLSVCALLGKINECIVFLCVFIPLRSFCGGYHASKAWQCILLSNFCIISFVLLAEIIALFNISIIWYLVIEICLGVIIIYFAPIESCNNKLTLVQRQYYKKYAQIIIIIEILLGSCFFMLGYQKVLDLILGAHMLQTVSLMIAMVAEIKNYE